MRYWKECFDLQDQAISAIEDRVAAGESVDVLIADAIDQSRQLLAAYSAAHGRVLPEEQDILELFRYFVKGDPSLNAVRDNIRELVYYQNCLAADRQDALPNAPARMVVHTVRHLYLYLHSRLEQAS